MERFGRLVAPVFQSCGRTHKLHKFAHHLVQSIERLGSLQDQSTSAFESSFSATKARFQRTSKRQRDDVHLHEMAELDTVQRHVAVAGPAAAQGPAYNTAWRQARDSGAHALAASGTVIPFMQARAPLRAALEEWWHRDADSGGAGRPASSAAAGALQGVRLTLVGSGMLAAWPPWAGDEPVLQRVHSAGVPADGEAEGGQQGQPSDRPYFDGVELARGPVLKAGSAPLRFAVVQQLFRLGPRTQLVFARFLAPVPAAQERACSGPAGAVLSRHGATLLQWAAVSGACADGVFAVVPLGDVIQRVQLVPDFAAWEGAGRDWYRVNPFLWHRDSERTSPAAAGGDGEGSGGGTDSDSDEPSESSDDSDALIG